MNVLIADKFASWGIEEIRAAGCEVTYEPALSGDSLREAVARCECRVLIVRGTKVTEDVLGASLSLAAVIRAGAGYNTIDVKAASRRSIFVANCPGKNAVAVAELTMALILALDRRIVENVTDLRNGVWNKSEYGKAKGIKGQVLGIIGMGQIGQAVARRAQPFGLKVIAWSRSLTPELVAEFGITMAGSVGEVAAACDILTIHLAAASATKGIINAEVLKQLKPGCTLINTSRSDVLDHAALAQIAKEKKLRVGLDVYQGEPESGTGTFSDPLMQAGGLVYGTHHIGASTQQAEDAIAQETVRMVREYKQDGRLPNCVNLQAVSPAHFVLTVRHRNRPGVLAHTLRAISFAGVNVEEMENVILDGAETACAQIKLDASLHAEALNEIRSGNEHVLDVTLLKLRD